MIDPTFPIGTKVTLNCIENAPICTTTSGDLPTDSYGNLTPCVDVEWYSDDGLFCEARIPVENLRRVYAS